MGIGRGELHKGVRSFNRAHNLSCVNPLLCNCRYDQHITQLLSFLYGTMQEDFFFHHDQQVIFVEKDGEFQFLWRGWGSFLSLCGSCLQAFCYAAARPF